MTYFVQAQTQVVGFHYWETAPEKYSYLRSRHRHTFTVTVVIDVQYGDRVIEVNELELAIVSILSKRFPNLNSIYDFGGRSCEHIALAVASSVTEYYRSARKAAMTVTVLEDGKNGGGVRWLS